jgi:hypothetical protein
VQTRFALEAQQKWNQARRQVFWAKLRANLGRGRIDLLDFNEVAQRLRLRNLRYQGIQSIPVDKIVGSAGRYNDFTNAFLPINASMSERWRRVAAISLNPEDNLPPIEVYQVGQWYFVRDGNHRVSVARQVGVTFIDAAVWEYTDLCAEPDTDIVTLMIEAERCNFLESTRLDDLRPGHDIRVSEPGGYDEMLCQIAHYQDVLRQIDGVETGYEDAVTAWYDMIYETSVQLIDEAGVLELFPDRSTADFFVWTTRHSRELEARYYKNVFVKDAARDFRKQNLGILVRWLWRALRNRLAR